MIFEDDPSSRKTIRFVLLVQITAVGIVLALILFQFYSLALSISCITFFVLAATALWLYLHYQKIPIVREKRHLQKRALDLQRKTGAQENIIQGATRKRTALLQDQHDEINIVLQHSQQAYINNGLEGSQIKDAQIPGVGHKLKERLAEHRITNAAQIKNESLSKILGFGESKRQALFSWRNTLQADLESTKPNKLTEELA